MADRLSGRVALVVGAGSSAPGWGIGKATAVLYAREGASVFACDVNAAAVKETVMRRYVSISAAVLEPKRGRS